MTTGPPEEHLLVLVVAHTHWDREWYRTAARFRPRLVALIDELLQGVAGSPFLLDGQAVVLEDYLEWRPECAADLSRALRAGGLEAGPWYVLADELIPSGEGLVRNLLAGRRVLSALRAAPPPVLYCPDAFGHPTALPALAAGFACPVVVLWRGYGGRPHPAGDTFRWAAPDESSVTAYHLPPDGYEFGSHLPQDPPAALERWQAVAAVLKPRAVAGLALLPAGADHHAVQRGLDEAVSALAGAARPALVRRSSLAAFAAALLERSGDLALPTVAGELRDSYGYTWTLQGTLGARAPFKRRYATVERRLVRDTEPWAALAARRAGLECRPALRAAWRPLLLCQPHDTLCGCSVDAVAREAGVRLDEAAAAADEIRESALLTLVGHDANAARARPGDWSAVVLVRNAAPRRRSGVAELEVDVVLDDAPVGPGSAGIEPRHRRVGPATLGRSPVPVQTLSREHTFAREEASRHYPWNRLVERRRVLAWLEDVPPLGLLGLPISAGRRRSAAPPSAVEASGLTIRNEVITVEISEGGVRLSTPEGAIADWIVLEAEGERGDLYTRSAIPGTRVEGRLVRARLTSRGPLRASLATDWDVAVPERRLTTAAGEPRRAPAIRQRCRVTLELDAAAPFVRLRVGGRNVTPDARLRIGFRSGLPAPVVVADAAFGPLERWPIIASDDARAREVPPPTAPLHRYVSLYERDRGVTVFSDGLAEYEAAADGIVWITLGRAVGELSRHDLPERPGHAGYPEPTPDAQCLGPFEAVLAWTAHGPRSAAATWFVERCAEDFLLPLAGETWRTAIDPPVPVSGAELTGDGLVLSAMKPSEDGAWIVLRCTNVLEGPVGGSWRLPGMSEAVLARLDETPLGSLAVSGDTVSFTARPRETVTILVR